MIKNCIICCYEETTKQIIINDLKEFNPNLEIILIKTERELATLLAVCNNITVYLDKYFLGIYIKNEITKLKSINPNAYFVFVEQGYCPVYFGMRIHNIGANGFICGIEDLKNVKVPFLKTLEEIEYFPEAVIDALNDIFYVKERKKYSEITPKELEICYSILNGETLKEISYHQNNISPGTISTHISRLKNKTGYKKTLDFLLLIDATKLNHITN